MFSCSSSGYLARTHKLTTNLNKGSVPENDDTGRSDFLMSHSMADDTDANRRSISAGNWNPFLSYGSTYCVWYKVSKRSNFSADVGFLYVIATLLTDTIKRTLCILKRPLRFLSHSFLFFTHTYTSFSAAYTKQLVKF